MLDVSIIADYKDIMTIAFHLDGVVYDIIAGDADEIMKLMFELYK